MSDNVARQKQFKNTGKHEEMRRRRAEGSLELRKQRKDEQLMKRRNVDVHDISAEDEQVGAAAGDQSKRPAGDPKVLSLLDCYTVLKDGQDHDRCLFAIESIRRHLSRPKNPPIDEVIKMGVLPFLVKALSHQSPKMQFEAAWALTNITSGNGNQTMAAVNEGIIPPLVRLLSSPESQVAEQSAWALGNITGESAHMRDVVIEAGIVEPLLALANRPNLPIDCSRTLAWTLSNLCRYKVPQVVAFSVLEQLAPTLSMLIHHPDTAVVCDICWAVAYISDGSEDRIDLVLNMGVLDRLVQLAASSEPQLIAPSLRALGNIVTGDDRQTQAVIDRGVLQTVLPAVLMSGKSALTREGCWLLSNICAGNTAQINAVAQSGLIPLVVGLMEKGDYRTQNEAVWVAYNICTGGTTEQACVLLAQGALAGVCNLFKSKESKVLILALDTLAMMLGIAAKLGQLDAATMLVEECDGLDQIEQLQNHENEDVYQKALHLVEKFFSEEGVEDTGEGPAEFQNPSAAPAGGFNF